MAGHILVTGGAGYIGSHTVLELLEHGYEVTVVDNLCNSSEESLRRVTELTGKTPRFIAADLCDTSALDTVFNDCTYDAVIHFAGLKAVGESVDRPLAYYRNNIVSTLNLLDCMLAHGVKSLVFSSSATVYGSSTELPLKETSPVGTGLTNPYGQTKYLIEQILRDVSAAHPDLSITVLRYFNPIGAHASGRIGEDPKGIPNNLLPYVSQVAVGKRDHLTIHGNDYDTPDGTCLRDYIHVVDLARGHLAALEHTQPGWTVYNLGTGTGTSVLEVVKAFENACGHSIAYEIGPRRPGDAPACYADVSLAAAKLGWRAEKTIADACVDAWRWQSQNPEGYNEKETT